MDGDGYDEVAIGAYSYDPSSRSSAGLVGLRYGRAAKLSGNTSIAALDASFAGATSSDYLGDVVKFIGDVNGDGYDELAVGAWGTDSPASSAGAVYIIPGSATRFSGMSTVTTAAKLTITGVLSSDYMGDLHSIAGPIDLDGDGYNDLVAGSKYIDSGTTYSIGSAYVFYGTAGTLSTSISFSVAFANASFTGGTAYDYVGEAPESAGDVNGDGYDDLVLGGVGVDSGSTTDVGCAYLIHGGSTRLSGAKAATSAAAATMCGKTASDALGGSVGGLDVNGDGYSDVYAGATGVDSGSTYSVGAMYVFYGPLSGSVSATAADATFTGTTSYGYVGRNSHNIDADSDGAEDLLVGAYGAGKVYTLFGGGL
ncbi:MAG: FG-GAP repeat protein [Deltaproteobacteria bacterium]|nr:FG-GAP repeat protein [Deltaproteobacteria bacterium]